MAPPGYRVYVVDPSDHASNYRSRRLMHHSRVNTASGPGFDIHYVKLMPYVDLNLNPRKIEVVIIA